MSVKFIKTGAQNQLVLNAKSLPSLQCCMSKNRELLDGANLSGKRTYGSFIGLTYYIALHHWRQDTALEPMDCLFCLIP